MKRDEAEDFLARRVSPHQSAIAQSPFSPPQQFPGGPMQPGPQGPQGRPMMPPPTNYRTGAPPQQPPFQQPMPGPPGGNMAPPQQPMYVRGPMPPQSPMPMAAPNHSGYLNGPPQPPMPMAAPNRSGYLNGPPPSMHDMAVRKQAHKKKRFPIWARVLVASLVVMIAAGGYFAMPYFSIVGRSTGQKATQFGTQTTKSTSSAMQTNNTDNGPVLSGKRINILLLGSDTDAKFDQGTFLAQTDIIVTIDPTTKYVGMLSIPRDMQVTIPGYGTNKLDIAFSDGYGSKKSNNPVADGAGLAIATIEQNFGIPIDQYAWVGLDGFIKVIDTAGGVDVDVLHPMVDDTYPDDVDTTTGKTHATVGQAFGYKRLYIAPGPQHLNGIQALEYVRTRHSDLIGDFGRSARQQQVLNQLKAKLQTSDTIAKLPELATDLDGYVKTSMNLTDLASMANFARTIDTNKIDRLVLSPPYSAPIKNSSNFAPVCDKIIPAVQKMFDLSANQATCIPQAFSGTAGLASPRIPTAGSLNLPAASVQTQPTGQPAQMTMLSSKQTYGDPFGVQCLLNLMFMVSLESFDAMATT
jgi:LCP family protein required for cell wall assembly